VAGTSRATRRQGVAHSAGGAGTAAGTACSARRSKIALIASASFAASITEVLAITTTSTRSFEARAGSSAWIGARVRVELLCEVLLDPERRDLDAGDACKLEQVGRSYRVRRVDRCGGKCDVDHSALEDPARERRRDAPPLSAAWKVRLFAGSLQREREAVAEVQRSGIEQQLDRILLAQPPLEVSVLGATRGVPRRSSRAKPPFSTHSPGACAARRASSRSKTMRLRRCDTPAESLCP
jgi:hypothetical protein